MGVVKFPDLCIPGTQTRYGDLTTRQLLALVADYGAAMDRLREGDPRRIELWEQHVVATTVLKSRAQEITPEAFAGAVAKVSLDRFARFGSARAGERSPKRDAEIAAELERQRERDRERGHEKDRER